MLDFKYRVFLSAAKLLSFSKAAKELSLTQPAVSFQIRHLEEELGARLFVRYLYGTGHTLPEEFRNPF